MGRKDGGRGAVLTSCNFIVGTLFHNLLAHMLIGELKVYTCSVVRRRCRHCRSPFSNISETAWPITTTFLMEPPWEGGRKVYINGPGHMTNMTAMPIYGKNL